MITSVVPYSGHLGHGTRAMFYVHNLTELFSGVNVLVIVIYTGGGGSEDSAQGPTAGQSQSWHRKPSLPALSSGASECTRGPCCLAGSSVVVAD